MNFIRHSVFKSIFLVLLLAFLCIPLSGNENAPRDFTLEQLTSRYPGFKNILGLARKHGVTLGFWGGTIRDLYLGRQFSVISDIDLIFDSRESAFSSFRNDLKDMTAELQGLPVPDFHFDLAALQNENKRQKLYHQIGITATKVGILNNGTLLDPTGYGVKDLRARYFRYFPVDEKHIEIHNAGRFIRDLVRLDTFQRDPGTLALLKRMLELNSDGSSEDYVKLKQSIDFCRKDLSDAGHLSFLKIVRKFRDDLRFLHNGLEHRLTKYYPADLLVMELFKTITQANDMESMRSVFASLGVGRFLDRLGLDSESALIMDPSKNREDLFRAFGFPGFYPPEVVLSFHTKQGLEEILKKYTYRTLFDMIGSEFPENSHQRRYMAGKRDEFLRPSTWRMIAPGLDFSDTLEGFLDADFNLALFPRDKVMNSLEWFIRTYTPHGKGLLIPLVSRARPDTATVSRLKRGYSPEIISVDRTAPHSFRDLEAYLELQTGKELKDFYNDPRTALAFFYTPVDISASILQGLGYDQVYLVNAPGFQRRKSSLIGFDRKTGRVILCYCGFYSDEQLLNHQARHYFLRRHLETGVTESIFVLRQRAFRPEELEKAVSRIKEKYPQINTIFIGFTNPLKNILKNTEQIDSGMLNLYIGDFPESGRKALSISGFGVSYGSLPAAIVLSFLEHGLENIVFIGSGGGLSGVSERFSWTLPVSAGFIPGGETVPENSIKFNNLARQLKLSAPPAEVTHYSVVSPLIESCSLARMMYQKQIGSVDCELYHIINCLRDKKNPPNIYALINLTDFPLTGLSTDFEDRGGITVENSELQYQRISEALTRISSLIDKKVP